MTDWRETKKAKQLKEKYFADAVNSCGQAVAKQRDLTPEDRVDLTLRCTLEALDTLETTVEPCEAEASQKWFRKGQYHEHCLEDKLETRPFDAFRYVQHQSDEIRTKTHVMSESEAKLKAWTDDLLKADQQTLSQKDRETAAALCEVSRVFRELAGPVTQPPACSATGTPELSAEDLHEALHCLEEAQKALSEASYRKFLDICTSDLPQTTLNALGFTNEVAAALPSTRVAFKKAQRALIAAARQKFQEFCFSALSPAMQEALGFTPVATKPPSTPPAPRFTDSDKTNPSGEKSQNICAGSDPGDLTHSSSEVGKSFPEFDSSQMRFDAAKQVGKELKLQIIELLRSGNYSDQEIADKLGVSREYVGHVRRAENEVFICEQCGKTFASQQNLKIHIDRVHKKLKPFVCEWDIGDGQICNKTFATQQDLQRHIDTIHKKETPYRCEECGKAFSTRKNLEIHINRVHQKSRSFVCNWEVGKNAAKRLQLNMICRSILIESIKS